MKAATKELRELINEERQAYNEEREKHDEDILNLHKMSEAKVRLIKNKLIGLYEGNIEIAKNQSIEEVIENISQRINQL